MRLSEEASDISFPELKCYHMFPSAFQLTNEASIAKNLRKSERHQLHLTAANDCRERPTPFDVRMQLNFMCLFSMNLGLAPLNLMTTEEPYSSYFSCSTRESPKKLTTKEQ